MIASRERSEQTQVFEPPLFASTPVIRRRARGGVCDVTAMSGSDSSCPVGLRSMTGQHRVTLCLAESESKV